MKALEQLERLQRINNLIKAEKTGTPDEFATSLHISRRQLYEYINLIKGFGVEVSYSKQRRTFYLSNGYELNINFGIKIISKQNTKTIHGGFSHNSFQRAFFMHGTQLV